MHLFKEDNNKLYTYVHKYKDYHTDLGILKLLNVHTVNLSLKAMFV